MLSYRPFQPSYIIVHRYRPCRTRPPSTALGHVTDYGMLAIRLQLRLTHQSGDTETITDGVCLVVPFEGELFEVHSGCPTPTPDYINIVLRADDKARDRVCHGDLLLN